MAEQKTSAKQLILCDCLGSQTVDAEAITAATGMVCSKIHTALCTRETDQAAEAIAAGDAIIACQQERGRFEEIAAEINANPPVFVDLRDRAGWSDDTATKSPKMAALAADALVARAAPKVRDVTSEGVCLIIGTGQVALDAAEKLGESLSVMLLQLDDTEPPVTAAFDVIRGRIVRAGGSLGQFDLRLDAVQSLERGGRGTPQFSAPQDGATSQCDIIVDLSGDSPLFSAHEKRDGYLRADPRYAPAVADVLFEAAQMIGTFEKPLYVRLEEALCAHSRAGQPACSNCLNACPTGAITSAGDHVAIDPMICAGCGACAALCPSGAIAYDAPAVEQTFRRIQVLAETYRKAGGQNPRMLVHDDSHGAQMIALAARFGRGLPADVIPFDVSALAGFGHAEMLAALGAGFAAVTILLGPTSDRDTIAQEAALAQAIAGRPVALLELADPDALSDALFGPSEAVSVTTPMLPLGTRRQVTRTAAKALTDAGVIPLPATAPYGAVLVDTEACTLCLSCVSLCPSGALTENEDKPQLRFQEDACLQCGLCSNICPEKAITLKPQLDLTDAAYRQTVLHEEDPFACVDCGSLFGVKSTIEKITEKLAGNHAMFGNDTAARMIQMCETCRIKAQYHADNSPFAGKERPRVRTTDDYLSKRRDH